MKLKDLDHYICAIENETGNVYIRYCYDNILHTDNAKGTIESFIETMSQSFLSYEDFKKSAAKSPDQIIEDFTIGVYYMDNEEDNNALIIDINIICPWDIYEIAFKKDTPQELKELKDIYDYKIKDLN